MHTQSILYCMGIGKNGESPTRNKYLESLVFKC